MKVVNINTKEIIEEIGDFPGVYWTTPEYWAEYKAMCRIEEDRQNKLLFYGGV